MHTHFHNRCSAAELTPTGRMFRRLLDPSALDGIEDSVDAAITFAESTEVTAQALRVLTWGGTLVAGVPLSIDGLPSNGEHINKTSIPGNRGQMRTVLELAPPGKIRTVLDRSPMNETTYVMGLLAARKLHSCAGLENPSA